MYTVFLLVAFQALAAAVPLSDHSNGDYLPAEHFAKRAVIPQTAPLSGWDIFRRQGCPNFSLLCPNGGCCSYATTPAICCGDECCGDGYVCAGAGDTVDSLCCVAISDLTNTCASDSGNTNPCVTEGYLPCVGIEYCCPSDTVCYYDGFNAPQCGSNSPDIPSPSPTPPPAPSPTPPPNPDDVTPSPIPPPIPVTPSPEPSPSPVIFPAPAPPPVDRHTGKKSFWTPAAIGGVAGGGVAFLILVAILICCCTSGNAGGGTWIHRKPHGTQPLTDAQIYWFIKDLETTEAWQSAYEKECERAHQGQAADLTTWMEDFAVRAVAQRIHQLRTGGQNASATFVSWITGFPPLLKPFSVPFVTKIFNNFAIECLGLWDTPALSELLREANSQPGRITSVDEFFKQLEKRTKKEMTKQAKRALDEMWMNSDLREHLKDEIHDYLRREYGEEVATEFAEEAVHLKFLFGQFVSMGRAAYKANDRMDKALDLLEDRATFFHLRIFVVNALARTIPSEEIVEIKN